MQIVKIDDMKINFYKESELDKANLSESEKDLHMEIYSFLNKMSRMLHVKCPDIAFVNELFRKDKNTGFYSVLEASMYNSAKHPSLKNNLILISRKCDDPILLTGVLDHEMRQIWQDTYFPEMNCESA